MISAGRSFSFQGVNEVYLDERLCSKKFIPAGERLLSIPGDLVVTAVDARKLPGLQEEQLELDDVTCR